MTQVADQVLTRVGLASLFERFLSVEDAGVWKPARAGMRTAWVNRSGVEYPAFFTRPSRMSAGITDVARELTVF